MKSLWLTIILCTVALFTDACQQSTLVPQQSTDKTRELLSRTWEVQAISTTDPDSTTNTEQYILDIRADGTYESSSPTSPRQSGRWVYNDKDSTIKLIPDNNSEPEIIKLLELTQNRIRLINGDGSRTVTFDAQTQPLFSVDGTISFEDNIQIPANHKLCVVWDQQNPTTNRLIWGEGKIDLFNKTFRIDFTRYPPDSLISRYFGCSGRVGAGYIYLLADSQIGSKQSGVIQRNIHGAIGIVKNRAIIYNFGASQGIGTQCPWAAGFNRGYNLGFGVVGANGYDFLPSRSFNPPILSPNNVLTVTSDSASLEMPRWIR